MSSPVTIANIALIRLGVKKILSFDDNVKAADVMGYLYDNARDTLLRRYPFKFAKARVTLATTTAPPFEYSTAYNLPADYVRMIDVYRDVVAPQFSDTPLKSNLYNIEGGQILTDIDSALNIKYISNDKPEATFDPHFVRLLSLQLALDAFSSLAGRNTSRTKLENEFKDTLDMAILNGSLEEPELEAYSTGWEDSRVI